MLQTGRRRFLQASLGALFAPLATRGAVACSRRPYVQNVRRTRATVRWTTYEPGEGTVLVRAAEGAERIVPARSVVFTAEETGLPFTYHRHEAAITGLTAGTDYSYEVFINGSTVAGTRPGAFRTTGTYPFTFLVLGDTGTGSGEQQQLANMIQAERARLLIHTGDLAYPTGLYETYERRYFDFYHATMSQVPFFPCPGNHDYYGMAALPYLSVHDLPSDSVPQSDRGRYYSFDWGDVHFVSLDSNTPLSQAAAGRGEMLQWLERDLAAAQKFWRVAFFHHPPYAFGPNSRDRESANARQLVVPILERYGVPLVLNGHEHSYQRTHPLNGTVYITTGGGGAGLYKVDYSALLAAGESRHHFLRAEVNERQLTIRAVGTNGEVFDSVVLSPPPMISRQGVVNAATFSPYVGRGSIVSVFGYQMAVQTLDRGGQAIARNLTDVRVTHDDQDLPLLMVSPAQINFVLPQDVTGWAVLRVITPGGSARVDVEIAPVAPALFPVVTDLRGGLVTPESPAAPGAVVNLYATGLAGFEGEVRSRVGGESRVARLSATATPGLQRVEVEFPSSLGPGVYSLFLEAAGVQSNSVQISAGE